MKSNIKPLLIITTILFGVFGSLFILSKCKDRDLIQLIDEGAEEDFAPPMATPVVNEDVNVTFYLENSGSMFGYVSQPSDFIRAINIIAADCDLNAQGVSYYLRNGDLTPLGSSLKEFSKGL